MKSAHRRTTIRTGGRTQLREFDAARVSHPHLGRRGASGCMVGETLTRGDGDGGELPGILGRQGSQHTSESSDMRRRGHIPDRGAMSAE